MKKAICTVAIIINLAGCGATLGTILATVLTVVTDAALIVDQVQDFIDIYFDGKPDPALQAKITAVIAKCQVALDMATRAARGGQALNGKDVAAALAEFQAAFADLMELVGPLGVKVAGTAGIEGAPVRLLIARPLALGVEK